MGYGFTSKTVGGSTPSPESVGRIFNLSITFPGFERISLPSHF